MALATVVRASRIARLALAVATALFLCDAARAQFSAGQEITSGHGFNDAHAADVDGDGDLDVVACRDFEPAVAFHENLGDGSFGPAQPFVYQPTWATLVTSADHDLDGDVDVFAITDYYQPASGLDSRVVHWRNLGDGTWANNPVDIDFVFGTFKALDLADLEGDGDIDLFYTSWSKAALYVGETLSNGVVAASGVPVAVQLNGVQDLGAADADGDGDADVILGSPFLGQVLYLENLDGKVKYGHKELLDAHGASEVETGDLDMDGDPDALWAGAGVQACENVGSGAFAPPELVTDIGFPGHDLRDVDMDGDGDLDALVGEFYGAAWYPNDGSGEFGARQVVTEAVVNVHSAEAADLDGDGLPDVLLAWDSSEPGSVAWYGQVVPTAWTDLGQGLPGHLGVPSLSGSGTLAAGAPGALQLSGAVPAAPALLLVALASSPQPFKCGTLVPVPVLASVALATGPAGEIPLAWAAWPAGLGGEDLYLQYAVLDASAACGVALSNALHASVP